MKQRCRFIGETAVILLYVPAVIIRIRMCSYVFLCVFNEAAGWVWALCVNASADYGQNLIDALLFAELLKLKGFSG